MTLVEPYGEEKDRAVMHCAMEAGHILLENGAEIDRVEETMDRICQHYAVKNGSFFVLSNGIFATDEEGHGGQFADVRHIPVHGARLDRVAAVNQLSREMEEQNLDVQDMLMRLQEIRRMPEKKTWVRILASAIGSGCFCGLFGGTPRDCVGAFIAGFLLYVFSLLIVKGRLGKLMHSICGGALVTLVCMMCLKFGLGDTLSPMIVGSVIPLVPGVAFTNGIRDIVNEDYIAGVVRLLDAMTVFFGIATGVGLMTMLMRAVGGMG